MDKSELLGLNRKLCGICGISGCEDEVREFIINAIGGFANFAVDALGNIIGSVHGGGDILLTAHMDEVGLIAVSVNSDGSIGFDTVGGIDERVLPDKRVTVNGRTGVISCKPVHLMSADEKKKALKTEEMYIDIGAKDEKEAREIVCPGDAISFAREYIEFGDGFICSPALDDRVGCAVLIALIRESDAAFNFAFTVQEEVGTRGAGPAAFKTRPRIAVAVETTTAADVPDVGKDKSVANLGEGAAISFMDRATVYDRGEMKKLIAVAETNGIMWQLKRAVAGGNDMGAIHKTAEGAKPVAISVPARYLHSPSVVVNANDIYETYRLLGAFIKSED